MKPETILGITALEPHGPGIHGRDSSACLSDKRKIIGAVSEERFTGNKHHAGFPWNSVKYLTNLGYSFSDIDAVAVPWPLKQSFSKYVKLIRYFSGKIPAFGKNLYLKPFLPVEKKKIIGIDHQLAHAASAYRTSPFKKALTISLDITGWDRDTPATGGIFIGENGKLTRTRPLVPSLALFYAFVTQAIGFDAVGDEGKTVSLAAFGHERPQIRRVLERYAPSVRGTALIMPKRPLKFDSVLINNHEHFIFSDMKTMHNLIRKYSRRDVAATAQEIVEGVLVDLVLNSIDDTGLDKICLAGEMFLNVKLNKAIRELKEVKGFYVYPNPGEGGAAAGAALECYYKLTGVKSSDVSNRVYLGPEYTDIEIEACLKRNRLKYSRTSDPAGDAAEFIGRGRIVGWFQGRMEWGSHPLGARSILAHPHDVRIKDRLNMQLKQHDRFMPFASSMLMEEAHNYLRNPSESPYMLTAYDVLPHGKDEIAAAVHVDNTVTPQTVTRQQNRLFYNLIKEHDKMTGIPVVLNTSFNLRGSPIVCTPEDAVHNLLMDGVDDLVIGNFIVRS